MDFLQSDEDTLASSSSDKGFYDTLQTMKSKNRQYLLELGLMYQTKLENIHKLSKEEKELEDFFQDNGRLMLSTKYHEALRSGNIRRFNSLTDLTLDSSDDEHNHYLPPQSFSKPLSTSATWISSITIPQPFKMTLREARKKSQLLKSHTLLELETTTYKKQSQEEAECQKQFRAQPVPAHIYLPLYQEIMEKNEMRRQVETQKRRELLLSMQKPFSFQEKEEKRKVAIRQKLLDIMGSANKTAPKVMKKIPRSTFEPMFGDKLKEAELLRKIRIQMRAKDLLESSWAPIELGNRQRQKQYQIATKNREQKLSFLQENFSFKPRINTSVPDFKGLYWAFQRDALSKREIKEATHNKPFQLRTSNLHCKHQEMMHCFQEVQQPFKAPVKRSRSLICLSSLSSNTLPVYITDAVRKRESAIRLLQEDKKYKENEGFRWAELQRKKCQVMRKSVNSRAKAMDPHKSLEEMHKEKLKQNWQSDQKRMKEYKKELDEMKMRVKNRPYLFEQITKHGARQGAQKAFRETLQQFGLDEEFVRNKGRETTDPVTKEKSATQIIPTSDKDTEVGIIKELSQEGQRRLELKINML
ncbi:protein FAM161B [Sceloporus undulatus]|uniref:protein FAM161B n=1 Tax=Sceloporus undulatus TaxID=8520 RepID=UPI001C4D07AE|nr:protein FAM161B [Sceloporus undulatus]